MKRFALFRLAPLAFVASAAAQTPAPAPAPPPVPEAPAAIVPEKKPAKPQWVFELLPKAFQKNPLLDLTVITEMTELGKQLPPVSPQQPAYYQLISSGYHEVGQSSSREHVLKQEDVERILGRSLATNGYLPTTKDHPPSLAIFYVWGVHGLPVDANDADNPAASAEMLARNLLDRAALVGGEKFAGKMLTLFQEESDLRDSTSAASRTPAGAIGPVVGPEQIAFMSPMHMFRMDAKNDSLVEQFSNDVYYVVASAYNYTSLANNQRQLLWRTRMTVATQGVSQEQTLPTLIASAAPYFGKDMAETEILMKKAVPEGKVEVGTPVVVGGGKTPEEKPAPTKE